MEEWWCWHWLNSVAIFFIPKIWVHFEKSFPQMWCGRTQSADAALDLFLRIFGRTPASFPIFRGICTNRRCCITDRPSIFSHIGTFTFTFSSDEVRDFILNCWNCKLQHIAPVAPELPVARLHNLARETTTCPTTNQPISFCRLSLKGGYRNFFYSSIGPVGHDIYIVGEWAKRVVRT